MNTQQAIREAAKANWLPQTQAEASQQPQVADEVWQTIDDARRALATSELVQESDGSEYYRAETALRESRIQAIADQETSW